MLLLTLFIVTVIKASSRGGGKTGMHIWQPYINNIGKLSYTKVQVFEHHIHRQFQAITRSMAAHRTSLLAHLSSDCVLCLLPGTHELSNGEQTLTIDPKGLEVFRLYQATDVYPRVLKAVQALIKARAKAARRKGNAKDSVDAESDEE